MAASAIRDILAGAIVLGVLVLLHEWGHFVVAKLCGVRVEIFSIGFGPRIWGTKRGDTDYRLSVLPLGGYVKMAGDNPIEERAGEPYEFLSRPRWQRFLIAIAGPAMNILVALVILWVVYAFVGNPVDAYLHQPAQVVAVPKDALSSGVQPNDRIVAVNGTKTATWEGVLTAMALSKPGDTVSLVVLRNGSQQALSVKVPSGPNAGDEVTGYPYLPTTLAEIQPDSPAQKAGLKAGDTVVSIDGTPTRTFSQLTEAVQGSGGQLMHFVVQRNGKDVGLEITPKKMMNGDDGMMQWMIGAARPQQQYYEHQGMLTAATDSVSRCVYWTRQMGDIVAGLFRGKISTRELAGPVGIVQLSGQAAKDGPVMFLVWMAYISLDLALVNLLPIPILDGGHVLMLAVEGSLRRDLSVAFKERVVQIGIIFLLGVFVFVFYNDILRLVNR